MNSMLPKSHYMNYSDCASYNMSHMTVYNFIVDINNSLPRLECFNCICAYNLTRCWYYLTNLLTSCF